MSRLFYEISGVKPHLADFCVGVRPRTMLAVTRSPELREILNPRCASEQASRFLKRQNLTPEGLQFDDIIETYRKYRDEERPTARGDYEQQVYEDLVIANTLGNLTPASVAQQITDIKHKVSSDHRLFESRVRLFCDMVLINAGEEAAVDSPVRLRGNARSLTRGFAAQDDSTSVALCILLEALLANNHAFTSGDSTHREFAIAAVNASRDMLIARRARKQGNDRRLRNIVLFEAAACGLSIAISAERKLWADLQLALLQDCWQDVAEDPDLHYWLMIDLLRAQSLYFLFDKKADKCAECLVQWSALHDRLGPTSLSLLYRICQWAQRAQANFTVRDALDVYAADWPKSPHLFFLSRFGHLLGPSVHRLHASLGKSSPARFCAAIETLSKHGVPVRL